MSFYSFFARAIKKLLGIEDFSKFSKDIHKRVGKVIYKKKYSSKELISTMCSLGMKDGSVVCIHCAMKEFYNFKGTTEDIIKEILKVIGPKGTLMMPSYPRKDLVNKPGYIFNKTDDPTDAGALAEAFRKYPGVVRSISVQHSVCAIGYYADYLIKDHYKCHDPWGEGSPYQRLCELGGIVFNLGMPKSYIGTFHHCVESELQYQYPYWAQFFLEKKICKYYDENIIKEYECYDCNIERRLFPRKITKYFTKDDWAEAKLSNLLIKAFYTNNCFPKMLMLGKKGIGIYYIPRTRGYSFDK